MDKFKLFRVIENTTRNCLHQVRKIETREDYVEAFRISRELNQAIINLAKLHWMNPPREIYQARKEIQDRLWEVVIWELIN